MILLTAARGESGLRNQTTVPITEQADNVTLPANGGSMTTVTAAAAAAIIGEDDVDVVCCRVVC